MTLCLENYEGISVETLATLVRSADSPRVRVCLDSLNSLGRGEGCETVLAELAPLSANVHVKDYRTRRLDHRLGFVVEGVAAGTGELPIGELLGRVPNGTSAVVELWTPWRGNISATCDLEMQWARESVGFLRSISGAQEHSHAPSQ